MNLETPHLRHTDPIKIQLTYVEHLLQVKYYIGKIPSSEFLLAHCLVFLSISPIYFVFISFVLLSPLPGDGPLWVLWVLHSIFWTIQKGHCLLAPDSK